jgi:hypothetical protein
MITTSRTVPRASRTRRTRPMYTAVSELAFVAKTSRSSYQRKDNGISQGRSRLAVATTRRSHTQGASGSRLRVDPHLSVPPHTKPKVAFPTCLRFPKSDGPALVKGLIPRARQSTTAGALRCSRLPGPSARRGLRRTGGPTAAPRCEEGRVQKVIRPARVAGDQGRASHSTPNVRVRWSANTASCTRTGRPRRRASADRPVTATCRRGGLHLVRAPLHERNHLRNRAQAHHRASASVRRRRRPRARLRTSGSRM